MELINEVASFARVPLIAHGGAGNMSSIREVVSSGGIDAVSASSVFHYGDFSVNSLKNYLSRNNIHVRF
jgi:cyclase